MSVILFLLYIAGVDKSIRNGVEDTRKFVVRLAHSLL